MTFINSMLIVFLVLISLTLGYDLGIRQEPKWIQNAPLATHIHKDKICFEWQGKYKTQVVSCIKRGN